MTVSSSRARALLDGSADATIRRDVDPPIITTNVLPDSAVAIIPLGPRQLAGAPTICIRILDLNLAGTNSYGLELSAGDPTVGLTAVVQFAPLDGPMVFSYTCDKRVLEALMSPTGINFQIGLRALVAGDSEPSLKYSAFLEKWAR